MTKLRDPHTFENAMAIVAGKLGWRKVADICHRAENTVRNWSDPDTSAAVTLDAALQLDAEYQAAGGDGAPFHQCYSTRLEAAIIAATPCREAIIDGAGSLAKESGEAIAAALIAARPGATLAESMIAEREIEESIAANTQMLKAIRAGRNADQTVSPGGAE
jgi:hypothetical protein